MKAVSDKVKACTNTLCLDSQRKEGKQWKNLKRTD